MARKLLLLSSSKIPSDKVWMHYAEGAVSDFLHENGVRNIAFVPFAGVTVDADKYLGMARSVFEGRLGFKVSSVHNAPKPTALMMHADAILVGGGNTHVLNAKLLHHRLRLAIWRRVVLYGTPYVGWSAGANIAFGGMETTNDMNMSQTFFQLKLSERLPC